MGGWAPSFAAVALLTACSQPFACEDDTQCAGSVDGGVCEPNGYCSFPDGDCPSGRRYGELSGGGLAGLCVVDDDATTGMTTSTTTTVGTGPLPTTSSTMPPSTSEPVDMDTGASTTDDSVPVTGSSSDSGSSSSTGIELDPDLLLWLEFEEDFPAAGGATDSTSNGHFAACGVGGCPTITAGPLGMGALFDGVDDLLSIHDDVFFLSDAFTLASWVRLDEEPDSGFASVMGKAFGDGDQNSYELYYTSMGEMLILGIDAPGNEVAVSPFFAGTDWTHVAATFDGSELNLFVGGELVDTADAPGPAELDDQPFTIGGDINGGAESSSWPGALDEVRVYSRALTGAEVLALASE